jgi:hypothetical protein
MTTRGQAGELATHGPARRDLGAVGAVLAIAYVAMFAALVGRENKPEGATIVNRRDSPVVVYIVAQDGRGSADRGPSNRWSLASHSGKP